jgi:hypothetical protein
LDTLILHIEWGGLGDHLFWSHIPRIAKEKGYGKVLVHCARPFRRPDYRLIWELNPYFDGFTDDPGKPPVPVGPSDVGPEMNLLDRHMLNMGLDDGKRWHEPEFYYNPKVLDLFKFTTVYDPNYVTGVGAVSVEHVRELLGVTGIRIHYEFMRGEKHYSMGTQGQLMPVDLLHYADIIHSCGHFICLASGGATLAAALGKQATVFYGPGQPSMFHHSKRHRYICAGGVRAVPELAGSWTTKGVLG